MADVLKRVLLGLVLLTAGCSGGEPAVGEDARDCADVVEVSAFRSADGTYTFDVTVRSADTGWDKYADLWEVLAPDGSLLGARILAHPHVEEQPFTRSQSGIVIPDGVGRVTVRARDSVEGYCGAELDVEVAP